MSGNATATALPNPFTPLAFLPPKLAFQASFATYVAVSTLAVLIWDILHNMRGDFKILFKFKITWPTVVYFVSRVASLGYVLGKSVQLTAELDDCFLLERFMCGLFTVAHSSTALLFYFRVCAVYRRNVFVATFFAITWLGVTAGAALTFGADIGAHIGPTRYCTSEITHDYIQATSWLDLFNDTLVFIAIMYKLTTDMQQNPAQQKIAWSWMFRRSAGLQRFTRAFLQDTQMYYLVAVVMNFATLIVYFAASKPPNSPFRVMLIFPNTTIVNIMACRVYRKLKLGQLGALPTSTGTGSAHQNVNMSHADPGIYLRNLKQQTAGHIQSSKHHDLESGKRNSLNNLTGVQISKEVEVTRDDIDSEWESTHI